MAWDASKKVYTRKGDGLTSSLPGFPRLSKADERFGLLGTMDELNSYLGLIRAESDCPDFRHLIQKIQENLMIIMGAVADGFRHGCTLSEQETERLEKEIDRLDQMFPRENRFYLPGESLRGAHMDIARTIARRTERCMAECVSRMDFPKEVTCYMNRLSDYLYVAARYTDYVTYSK